jgi:aspartate aminotransferase-like enzyme
LRNLGFELFVPDEYHSNTVTTALSNSAITAEELIRFLKEEQGILIGGGIDELRGKVFRIGHMGPQATLEMILPLLFGIEEALRAAGASVEPGQSLRGLDVRVG